MKPYIYIETSVVSYLTARPSKDLVKLACQQITQSWWNTGRLAASHFISPYVIEEANAGDPSAASERIKAIQAIPVLPISEEIPVLAEFLLLGGGLPSKARLDALHIACVVYHEMNVLLIWNCTNKNNQTSVRLMN